MQYSGPIVALLIAFVLALLAIEIMSCPNIAYSFLGWC